jgi:hypothetical protein
MLFALGAAATLLDGLQSLTSSLQPTASSAGQAGTPFDLLAGTQTPGSSGTAAPSGFGAQISPQTLGALLDAQSAAGSSTTASLSPSAALQDLFSQIDSNGNGQISKSEFENALGAGGTNIAQADKVFNELDTNGDGSVSLNELKSALQGAGGLRGGHHFHVAGGGDAGGGDSTDSSSGVSSADPLMQVLQGASSSSLTNSDGSTTTTITYSDGSKVTMTTPAASTGTGSGSSAANSATSSYNWIEQMIQRQAQAVSANAGYSLSLSA